jgi:hypothetical protein
MISLIMIYFVGMDKWEFVDKLSLVYHVGIFRLIVFGNTYTTKSQSTGSIEGHKDFISKKTHTHTHTFKLIKTITKEKKECRLFVK